VDLYAKRILSLLKDLEDHGHIVPEREAIRIVLGHLPEVYWVQVREYGLDDYMGESSGLTNPPRHEHGFLMLELMRKLKKIESSMISLVEISSDSSLLGSEESVNGSLNWITQTEEINGYDHSEEEVDSETSRSVRRHESVSNTSGMFLSN